MLMPAQTHRFHLPWNDPRCDTLTFLNIAARRGVKFVDCNAVVSADGTAWNMHWGNGPRLNHYDWIWTGKRRWGREVRRPMTEVELRRDVGRWSDEAISRWRRAKHGGPKPATVRQRQRQAKRRAVYVCWELKSAEFGDPEVAARVVEDVHSSGWPGLFMALVTMRAWRQKARAIKEAGGQFALLAHDAPKPADLEQWRPYIERIWGTFR